MPPPRSRMRIRWDWESVAECDCSRRDSATISRVRDMETKPESRRVSASSKMVSRGRATAEKEKKKIMKDEARRSGDASVGA
jgi:hypothetical protein